MTDEAIFTALHYMPVEVSGQLFGVPMADVAAVFQMPRSEEGSVAADPAKSPDIGTPLNTGVPIIDLSHLFWGTASSTGGAFAVVLSTSNGTCAVLVDRVRTRRTAEAEAQHSLPHLAVGPGQLFSHVVWEEDALVLVINGEWLLGKLRQLAPELIVEYHHVTESDSG